ncbi:MAG: hypothetical protein ACE5IR_02300 [bacterium]
MKPFLSILIILVCWIGHSSAQQGIQQRLLVDLPTAGTLERGSFDITLRMFGNGGLLGGVAVGITPRFMFGLSFGGENIIGSGDVNWNQQPGFQAMIRLIDETFVAPAITLGFNSQGYGPYNDALDRYEIKSRGLYAVASKNYAIFHNLGIHGGINYSLENDDDDKDLNVFFGADLSFNPEFRFIFEYDVARNDNENEPQFGSGNGYMNLGFQWSFSDRLFLQFHLKNLLENGAADVTREIKIGYFEFF